MDHTQEIKPAPNAWRTTTMVLAGLCIVFTVVIIFAFSTHRIRLLTDAERYALIAQELPLATPERLNYELAAVFPHTFQCTTKGNNLTVHVDMSDMHPNEITYRNVVRTFAKALSALHESGYHDLNSIMLSATYPFADPIKNNTDFTIATVTLDRNDLKKINWNHILRGDVFELTKKHQLHPVLMTSPVAKADQHLD
ncbi:hypothetical protein [Gimesia sp.]|uniref:hypothetical protein n=1 Tax=Gimesia sp. TaxID=2024833 RepID=UPI003A94D110